MDDVVTVPTYCPVHADEELRRERWTTGYCAKCAKHYSLRCGIAEAIRRLRFILADVSIGDLIIAGRVSRKKVRAFVALLDTGVLPPIVAVPSRSDDTAGKMFVVDGNHRATAYKDAGRQMIPTFTPTSESFE